MKANYSYQPKAAKNIFEMATSGNYLAAVLAAAPNAGKSTIIIHVINHFVEAFPGLNVVILTHNQNLLKDQMLAGFAEGFVTPNFTYGEFGSSAQVQVGIPASRSKIKSIDLLIVDEAHQYYGAAMLDQIKAKHSPKFEVLMTGSPSIYNQANQNAGRAVYGMYYISGEELVEYDVYSDIVIDVVKTEEKCVVEQYKATMAQIKADKRLDTTKLMIAVKTVNDAYTLGLYLRVNGRKIALSTAESDTDNVQIARFKSGEADTLIVVNKGILGFSDNLVTGMIDLKSSSDIDARNQLFARVLRKHPEGVKKFYISAASSGRFNKEVSLLYKVANLMKKEVFKTYTKAA